MSTIHQIALYVVCGLIVVLVEYAFVKEKQWVGAGVVILVAAFVLFVSRPAVKEMHVPPHEVPTPTLETEIGACQGDSYFCDSCKWTDPSVPSAQAVLTTVTLYSAGEYRGGPLPPELGGPNGLGANAFELNNETLSFVYRKAGRTRVDDMLSGRVHKDGDMKFQFTVTGGYYGQSLTGKIFVFERIP